MVHLVEKVKREWVGRQDSEDYPGVEESQVYRVKREQVVDWDRLEWVEWQEDWGIKGHQDHPDQVDHKECQQIKDSGDHQVKGVQGVLKDCLEKRVRQELREDKVFPDRWELEGLWDPKGLGDWTDQREDKGHLERKENRAREANKGILDHLVGRDREENRVLGESLGTGDMKASRDMEVRWECRVCRALRDHWECLG